VLAGMDAGMSDAAIYSADAQFDAQHSSGITARFELPVSSTLGIRVEAAKSSMGIVQIPWSGPNEWVASPAGVGRVEMRQLLLGMVRHPESGPRLCPYAGAFVGVHDFSYRGLGSSGLTVAGLAGFDVALAQHDSVFLEVALNIAGNSSNPPFTAVTVDSVGIAIGIKHRF